MLRSIMKTISLMLASSALLAACGGGGGDNAGNPPTQTSNNGNSVVYPSAVISSVFDGTTDAGKIAILLQDDGSYFIVSDDASSGHPSRVMLGTGALNNGSFASSDGLDLTLVGMGAQETKAFNLSASYTEKSKLNGTISYAADNKSTSFTGDYNSSYETLPDLAAFAGVYIGSIANKDLREDNIELTISADGKLTGHLSCGCVVSAQLQAHNSTAYDAKLVFSHGSNSLTGQWFAGNVYLDNKTKRLYIVGTMNGTQERAIFVGTRS